VKIEEVIQQSTFRTERERLLVNLTYTYTRIQFKMNEELKAFGLSAPQFNALRILKGQHPKPASVKLVMERMLDVSSNASRLVDKLVEKKLVERKSCDHDRRQVDVLITKKGLEIVSQATTALNSMIESLTMKDEEARMFNDMLDAIRDQILTSKPINK